LSEARRHRRKSLLSKDLRQLFSEKKLLDFPLFINVMGLTVPIIYNRIKEIDMTFFVLLVGACLIGLVGAEVMNAQ